MSKLAEEMKSLREATERLKKLEGDALYIMDVTLERKEREKRWFADGIPYRTKEEAILAAWEYNKGLEPPHEIDIRSKNHFRLNLPARYFRGTYDCPICGYDRPHCHSKKEIGEGTVDIRTSTWWPEKMREKWIRDGIIKEAAP